MEIANEPGFSVEVSQASREPENPDPALADLARRAVPALADACAIQALDSGRKVETLTVARADPEAPDRVSIAHRRAPQGQPREPTYSDLLAELPAGCSLVLPLVSYGRLLGSIAFAVSHPGGFAPERIRAIEAFTREATDSLARVDRDSFRAETGSGRTRDLLQATLAAIPDVLSVIGADGKILFANEAAVRATKSGSLEEYLAADLRELQSRVEVEDERGRRVAAKDTPAATALRTGEDVTRLLRLRDPATGTIRWMEAKASCVKDGDGKLRYVVICARDVTRLKAAQDALAAQEQRLRLALDVGNVGVWELDVRTDRVSWTERMCAMHGLAPGQHPRGQAEFLALVHPDDRQKVMAAFLAAESRKHFELEYRVPGRHGEARWIHSAGGYQFDAGGSSRRIVGAAIEITERKRAEEAALRMQERVRQAQNLEAIGRMAGGMSHDFNNLLTAINGYADLILHSVREDQVLRDYASNIIASGTRAVAITQTLLAYSRRQLLITEVADASGIMRHLHDLARKLAPENVAVAATLPSAPEPVRVDVGKLKQAVMQVVMNALEAMPRGGRLTLSARSSRLREPVEAVESTIPPGRYVILEVADTGTGIEPEVLGRIFDPYFTTKKLGDKSGLGLSLAQGVIRQHGGYIQVATRVGSGTRFRMYLPPASAHSPAPADA